MAVCGYELYAYCLVFYLKVKSNKAAAKPDCPAFIFVFTFSAFSDNQWFVKENLPYQSRYS